ncbi:MAG: CDP-alcohol phosphatidyltransferase family protein [Saprospiraceae bacterium]|nr:CDP-alcohol phosphatidyltransferase family protein [Saprospiraceae bacterium]
MSKLADKDKFIDFSDYGRPVAKFIALRLKNTHWTPIHLTLLFGLCGIIAVYFILTGNYFFAAVFLILKSILDAADGELSRVKNTPSHSGRFLDSIFDIVLNFMIFLAIFTISSNSFLAMLLAFVSVQLQGTLYNYYYVILRNRLSGGDDTSKIFQRKSPTALTGERQEIVDIFFRIFNFLYFVFDNTIHSLDNNAYKVKSLPNWFMSLVSIYGLGFQLLIIAFMLPMGLKEYIIPFFIGYNVLIPIFIFIRKSLG